MSGLGPYDEDGRLAHELATDAGELLLRLRDELGFADAWDLRDEGDRRSHVWLTGRLRELRPADAVLSEEGVDDLARLEADRLWIVDPLDGTNEYGESGRSDWAVHVALWDRADTSTWGLVAGAVALPAQGRTLSTHEPLPALADRDPAQPIRITCSRSRRAGWVDTVARRVGGVIQPIGSAGAKAMAVVLGEVDAYVHRGPMKEWDSAAPVAVARAAGLHVSRLDGSGLTYNTRGRLTTELLVCHPAVAEQLLDAVHDLAEGGH